MNIIKSKSIGYCHGVFQTIKKAEFCLKEGKERNIPVYTIGTLIHNPDVVHSFEERGCITIDEETSVKPGIALIRAHGIPDDSRQKLLKKGFELVDATCINIQKSKQTIRKDSQKGRTIVVLGVPGHAEAKCLVGTSGVETILVSDENDVEKLFEKLPEETPVTLVTQTTFPKPMFDLLSGKIANHYPDVVIGSQLCPVCLERKKSAIELSKTVEAIVVVGGKNSENTKNLSQEITNLGKVVFAVENERDFNKELDRILASYKTVGICSGTSTPDQIIDKVCQHLATLETDH